MIEKYFLDFFWKILTNIDRNASIESMVALQLAQGVQIGMAMGQGGAEGWDLCPRPAWFCLATSPPCPAPHYGKNFLISSPPLGPHEAPPYPVKLYFLLIFPTTNTIFLMKLISLIKIHLELQLNLSHQIKSIFRKKKIE